MTKRTRWIVIVAVGACVAIGTGLVVLRPVAVETVTVMRRDIDQRLVASGRVLPPARVAISATVGGVVKRVLVKEGDTVQANALLISLDDREAKAQVAQARAGVSVAEAKLEQMIQVTAPLAMETHRQADANLHQAELEFQRGQALAAAGALSESQLSELQHRLDIARAQHDASETQLGGTRVDGPEHHLAAAACAQASATLAAAQIRLEQTQIRAQAPAIVLHRDVEPGEMVPAGKQLLELGSLGETTLSIAVEERSLEAVKLGLPAQVVADASPKMPFSAEVSQIAPLVDRQRGTLEVRLVVPKPPDFLKADMTVSVDLLLASKTAALVVPIAAIEDLATQSPFVWVVRDNRVEQRPVTTGLRDSHFVEVASGLALGDVIVVGGGKTLTANTRVRARESKPKATLQP